jgi:hypothetical protein
VRRVVDSDNSCLFNAVGYNMERSRREGARLRCVVAAAVKEDPITFNDGVLEKSNAEYQKWILSPEKWGGPIELFILATCVCRLRLQHRADRQCCPKCRVSHVYRHGPAAVYGHGSWSALQDAIMFTESRKALACMTHTVLSGQ